ncbi:Putative exonuclease GOR [Araneus ventricosus]|uniref:Exonuclease GOR n=1 Tax=Araneus ventricosus TaxID=182803 RepID=A0A4Y2JKJ2_ARAVE|nr:Putative exonuclease GOR [Araneus ventricosus]
MKDLIQKYLNCIPLPSEELYNRFLHHKMSYLKMMENGFPLPDPESPGKVLLFNNNVFTRQNNPEHQTCRCGKTLSMLDDKWYLDDEGCHFHLGKQLFVGPEYGLYTCCKKVSPGCAFNKHHVSFYRPFEEIKFVHPEEKKEGGRKKASNIFSIDCEMAFTTKGMEAVKTSLVSINGEVLYDSYVQPNNPILDYNTAFSGVREEHLRQVTTKLEDVQDQLLRLLNKDSILIGHGVENDLLALNLVHENVIDTSFVFPHERGHPLKNSLKYLAETHLHKHIQDGYVGHNSIEDAKTCMELMLWKIYSETRATFVARPRVPKPFAVNAFRGNNFYSKYSIPYDPYKLASMFPPTFVCFQVPLTPPIIPFVATVCTSANYFPPMGNQWWPRHI